MSAARAETFDVFTFAPPPGKRDVLAEAVGFTEATLTTFTICGVYRAARSSGDAARDFAGEWDPLVTRSLGVTDLKRETADWPGLEADDGRGQGVERSDTQLRLGDERIHRPWPRGHGADQLQRRSVQAEDRQVFFAGIRVALPAAAAAPAAPAAAPAADSGAPVLLTSNEWYRATGSAWAPDGYLRYRFAADGSCSFMQEWWSRYHHADYRFIEESGHYRLDGGTIQLAPSNAVKILRDKTGATRGEPEPVTLQKATYRYRLEQLLKPTLIVTPPRDSTPIATANSSPPLPATASPTTTSRLRRANSGRRWRTAPSRRAKNSHRRTDGELCFVTLNTRGRWDVRATCSCSRRQRQADADRIAGGSFRFPDGEQRGRRRHVARLAACFVDAQQVSGRRDDCGSTV